MSAGECPRALAAGTLAEPVKGDERQHELLHYGVLDKAVDIVERHLVRADAERLFYNIEIFLNAQQPVELSHIVGIYI